jgi:hypothetical protein
VGQHGRAGWAQERGRPGRSGFDWGLWKSKNQPTKWQFFHENHQFGKVGEMKGTDGSFVPVGFSRTGTERLKTRAGNVKDRAGGIDGLKNRSEKCEGLGREARRVKEPEREGSSISS